MGLRGRRLGDSWFGAAGRQPGAGPNPATAQATGPRERAWAPGFRTGVIDAGWLVCAFSWIGWGKKRTKKHQVEVKKRWSAVWASRWNWGNACTGKPCAGVSNAFMAAIPLQIGSLSSLMADNQSSTTRPFAWPKPRSASVMLKVASGLEAEGLSPLWMVT